MEKKKGGGGGGKLEKFKNERGKKKLIFRFFTTKTKFRQMHV
jgi:hypothetical protein